MLKKQLRQCVVREDHIHMNLFCGQTTSSGILSEFVIYLHSMENKEHLENLA